MLSEVSQIQKDKYCMFSLICGRLRKTRHREAEIRKHGRQRVGVGRLGRVSLVKGCKVSIRKNK